jgi:Glycogen debranching enzyme
MRQKITLMALAVVACFGSSAQPSQRAIFTSPNFSIFPDLVTWKADRAFLKGDTLYSTFNGNDEPVFSSITGAYKRSIILKNTSYPQLKSSVPMVDALYNMTLNELDLLRTKDGYFDTGKSWGGVWTRDLSYATILGIAIADPEVAMRGLMRKNKDGHIIQDTGSGGSWPISSDRNTWALAAWEVYQYTGDRKWLETIYPIIKNTVEADLKIIFYPGSLPLGESSFLDWREQTYPQWMKPIDIYRSANLGTSVVHYQTYNILNSIEKILGVKGEKYGKLAEEVKVNINKQLWMGDKGYYGQYLYGINSISLSPRSEALGEALAVLYNVADAERSQSVVANVPITEYGTTCIFPQIPEVGPYHNNSVWPFVQAFWNIAAAKVKNEAALTYGMSSIYRAAALFLTNKENFVASTGDSHGTAINSDRQLWSVGANIGMTYKVILGMNFETNGIDFAPVIPQAYAGKYSLTSFKYRNATINVTVDGFGYEIASFTVNGVEQKPFVDGNASGVLNINIKMKNAPFAPSKVNLRSVDFAPATPTVVLNAGKLEWRSVDGATAYVVTRNGKVVGNTSNTSYAIGNDDCYTEYQVKAIDARGYESFLSNPIAIEPQAKTFTAEAEDFNPKSDLPYANFSGKGFVEMTTTKNTKVTIPVTVGEEGDYLLTLRYSNGTDRMCCGNSAALRTLWVNGKQVATMVFPIVEKDAWSDWSRSNAVRVHLKKGTNALKLTYEKHNRNMNGDINMLMLDNVKVVKL